MEVAAAICVLLSHAASFINGANLQVDRVYTAT
jgi:NAD(P)-dependent dehydrogenase (short-subunit alcohol dehydrogenase family)